MRWLTGGLRMGPLFVVASLAVTMGCSDDERPKKSNLSSNELEPERRETSDAGGAVCTRPGCGCEDEGATRDCGTVKEQVAGYLWCSLGLQVCQDGAWSECQSERVVLSKQMLNLRLQGLGASRECGDENPCSPGCNLFEDDALPDSGSGALPLSPDSGLQETDGGLALAESPNVPGGLCASIELTPENPTMVVTGLAPIAPNSETFTATLLPEGCAGDDVEVLWSLDRPELATLSNSGVLTLQSPVAGPIQVSAFAGRLSATATLNVVVQLEDESQSPPGMADEFDAPGADEDQQLQWLYPYAGTVFPPNVNAPLVQWDSPTTVEASWNGGCALRADGRVRCWGTNVYGEIADRVGPYLQLSGRYAHFCALTTNRGADCWGENSYGQAEGRTGPFTQVIAGAQHSCAIRLDGTVECWGRNNYGQAAPPAGVFTRISGGAYTTCGLRTNGDVVCWGNSTSGQGGTTTGPFLDVSAGTDHVCAIRMDNAVVCWGANTSGQLNSPGGEFVALDSGTYHTCALRPDGSGSCWGSSSYGQTGTLAGPLVAVTAAREHSCSVAADGGVHCFGNGEDNHTVGLPGGAVQIGVRYPATGDALFSWRATIAENRVDYADGSGGQVPITPAPRFRIPDAVWEALSLTARGDEFAFTLQRHTGDRLLQPVERRVRFSGSPLVGKIVYQSYGTREVLNTTGTYEDDDEQWGAAVFSYDARSKTNGLAAGFASSSASSGTDGGCRGCHSMGQGSGLLLAGFDNQRDAVLRGVDEPNSSEMLLPAQPREWGGTLWSAIHPTLPLAFTSRGPTPCATRLDDTTGSCDAADFISGAGDLAGVGHVIQAPPGGMLGAAWFDSNDDGTFDAASSNQFIDLTTGELGAVLASSIPDALRAAMPAFSPEGDRVAFLHYAGELTDGLGQVHAGDRRSLAMMDFDGDALELRNFQRLTQKPNAPCDARFSGSQACVDVWPSFLPSSAGVVFEQQIFANGAVASSVHSELGGTRSGCEAKDQTACNDGAKGELWWVALDSDGQPTGSYRLEQANGMVSGEHLVTSGSYTTPGVGHSDEVEPLLSYQPSAAPRTFGQHHWVSFTSRRTYGNVATQNPWWSDPRVHPIRGAAAAKKVWISALEADAQGGDPSAPAFYLEGQEVRGANGRPVWVDEACVAPMVELGPASECESDADCCGAPDLARCEVELPLSSPAVRHCVPVAANECVSESDTRLCQSDEECCGFASGERCASGRCQQPPLLARYQPATFERDFHAECPERMQVRWKFLEWQAKLPPGTSIQFSAASAATVADLADAGTVFLGSASPPDTTTWTTWSTSDEDSIDSKLEAEGHLAQEWLRVTMTLNPDESLVSTPVLTSWRLVYDCADAY